MTHAEQPVQNNQHLRQGKEEARELSPEVREYELLRDDLSRLCTRIAMAERELQELAQPNDAKDKLAFETAAKHVEKADKWLKNAIQRRNTLLKILEYYSRRIATDIPAARCGELKQGDAKQITASPLAPAASLGGKLTTEHHLESVASATK